MSNKIEIEEKDRLESITLFKDNGLSMDDLDRFIYCYNRIKNDDGGISISEYFKIWNGLRSFKDYDLFY